MIRKLIDWLKFLPLFILSNNITKDMHLEEWEHDMYL